MAVPYIQLYGNQGNSNSNLAPSTLTGDIFRPSVSATKDCKEWETRIFKEPPSEKGMTSWQYWVETGEGDDVGYVSSTPWKFNIAPEKWWLEDYFPIGKVTFQGLY